MAKMKAAVITKAGSDFEIQGREIPQPGAGQVRIRVHACGRRAARVGVGWHGGQDGTCISCRRGNFGNCVAGKITGR